ncbi:SAM-dependent methyltransferase [Mucilaginibacter sp. McL0603]|uniref:SAM-dependent methyltransferase n=1 Tax=Mucilaginibacter sp. McL0603 TaxID=3415670 RepID=UPI003CF66797
MTNEWFYDWFNSPYYHLLYNKRDNAEAEYFVNNLCEHLKPQSQAKLFDIACGRGRFSVYLNKHGYDVTGIDLSVENIRYARQFENDTLHFFAHDMRQLSYCNYFDMAFNLFTSFGYFKTDEEHIRTLINFNRALKPGGLLVIDYFNTGKVLDCLVPEEIKTIKGVDFHIQKAVSNNKIVKAIVFEDKNKSYTFKEMVSAFTLNDFKRFFAQSGFEIIANFGNYSLEKFDSNYSDRLIFICKKANA